VHARYQQIFDPSYPFPDEGYQGDYIRDVAEDIRKQEGDTFVGKDDKETIDFFRKFAVREMIALIDRDLKNYGVRLDVWSLESALYSEGKVERALALLRDADTCMRRMAPSGSAPISGTTRPRRREKQWRAHHFAGDIAYHMDSAAPVRPRHRYLGADHHGYVRAMAVIKALDIGQFRMHRAPDGQSRTGRSKMSTRRQFVTLDELVRVGLAVTLFLMRNYDIGGVDFDSRRRVSNLMYYVQYACASSTS
jgi:arginyl-tRNA synthetase